MRALFSRSLRVASFWRFWLFSRCTNARARTRTRSRDPGRLIQDRVAAVRKFALSKEEADSPRAHSSCYFRRAQSIINPPPPPSTTVPSSCEINPLPPPSLDLETQTLFSKKKTQYFDTFRLYISFLSFPLLSSPCIGNNLWTTTTVLGKHLFHPYFHSVTDHAKSRERTSGHLSAGILRNFELFTGSYVIKGEAGSVGNRVVFVLFSIFLFSRSLYIGQIRQDF